METEIGRIKVKEGMGTEIEVKEGMGTEIEVKEGWEQR